MDNYLDVSCKGNLQYFGHSDLLAQVAYELINHPESCFGRNLISWYNALYSADPNEIGCTYQVESLPPTMAQVQTLLTDMTYSTFETLIIKAINTQLNALTTVKRNQAVNRIKKAIQ